MAETGEMQSHRGGTRESQKGGDRQWGERGRTLRAGKLKSEKLPRAVEDAEKRGGTERGTE